MGARVATAGLVQGEQRLRAGAPTPVSRRLRRTREDGRRCRPGSPPTCSNAEPGPHPELLGQTPGRQRVQAAGARLLPDKDAALVTYCSNAACANSGQVASKLEKLGYTNVRKYAGGIQDWSEAGLPIESGLPARS